MLAFLIIVKCLKHHFNQESLNIKNLYLQLEYSELAVRKQILRLKKMGWLEVECSHLDKRVKYLFASKKLIEHCNQILKKTSP